VLVEVSDVKIGIEHEHCAGCGMYDAWGVSQGLFNETYLVRRRRCSDYIHKIAR